MIFSVDGSIQKIIDGTKTQTRRPTGRYRRFETYAIQPGRTKPGIPEGKIKITDMRRETKNDPSDYPIWLINSQAEGGYTPKEFEELYEKMYPGWTERYFYTFKFIPSGGQP